MIRMLARDAVRIKMTAREESPLISAYEFCYAAGVGCRILSLSRKEADGLHAEESFADFRTRMQELAKDADDVFRETSNGERLLSLIRGCRCKGQMDEDARALFQMGYLGQ